MKSENYPLQTDSDISTTKKEAIQMDASFANAFIN